MQLWVMLPSPSMDRVSLVRCFIYAWGVGIAFSRETSFCKEKPPDISFLGCPGPFHQERRTETAFLLKVQEINKAESQGLSSLSQSCTQVPVKRTKSLNIKSSKDKHRKNEEDDNHLHRFPSTVSLTKPVISYYLLKDYLGFSPVQNSLQGWWLERVISDFCLGKSTLHFFPLC